MKYLMVTLVMLMTMSTSIATDSSTGPFLP